MADQIPSHPPRPAAAPDDRERALRAIRRVPAVAAALAIVLGVALLEGYVFGVGRLIPLAPFLPPTQPLVAVMFLFAGIALLSLHIGHDRLQWLGALALTIVAGLVVAEYLFDLDLGIDRLLFAPEIRVARIFPGRPAPITGSSFLVLGLAMLLARPRSRPEPRRWDTILVLGAIVLPVIAVVGHLLGVTELYAATPRIGTALHVALGLLLLALGTAVATHQRAVIGLLLDRDPGTVLLRRLLPLAVLLPILFAVGSLAALSLGFYQIHIGLAFYVTLCIGVLLAVAFWVAAIVRQADAERRAADQAQAKLALRERLLQVEKESGAALRERDRRTRELLEVLSHAPVLARGLDGRIRFWSAGAERLYGWSSEEAVGADAQELLHTEWPIPPREALAALLHGGEWNAELVRQARDGSRVQVASHWILHHDDSGRPDAVIEVDNDVTEQHRVEEARRRGEARYRALVAATSQIVWTASADGKRPTDMNQWEAFTGQTPEAAAWGGWLRVVHPDDRREAARAWSEAVQARKPLVTQHRLRRRDGEYRHMDVRAVPVLDDTGRIREWIGAHTDITDRVKAEEQLGQAQKLQAVGTLAGGVAHEVNNQLMAVLGFGDFVLKELGPDHPQTSDVREMIRGATRAARVAQQLLTFSRRQVHQTRLLDVHGAVEALAPVLERLLGADKGLVLAPGRAQRQVLADSTQLDQVLINLAANARDAMGTGGRLRIGTDDVLLSESYARAHGVSHLLPGPYVRLTVSDTGCGMDRATMAKIFEPFFTTKPVGAGTGLGLSTVYGIVKQHEGFIWAYSEPGMGTTLKIYLPAATAVGAAIAESPAEPLRERGPELEPGVVLVVEDEASVRSMVRRALEAVGLTVVEAENGRQALEVVATRGERPKLVLTDVIMPGLNGRELSEALSMTLPGLPVLFMSGYTGDDVLARSLLPATAPFIQKPFAPEELVARVRMMLGGLSGGRH